MFNAIQKRLRKDDRGFTLIELMVVVLIIAILIAIAIPTFLGAREKAQNRAAQSDLRQGLLTAKTYYTDNESFLDVAVGGDAASSAAEYALLEPSLTWVDVATMAGTKEVAVGEVTADDVVLVVESAAGDWFCIHDSTGGPTEYGRSSVGAGSVDGVAECIDPNQSTGWA